MNLPCKREIVHFGRGFERCFYSSVNLFMVVWIFSVRQGFAFGLWDGTSCAGKWNKWRTLEPDFGDT